VARSAVRGRYGAGVDVITGLYAAIDARDGDALAAHLAPDVDWPEPMQGGRVVGRDAVREHWRAQWAALDLQMRPRRVRELPDGRVEVLVEVVARDADGDLLGGATVLHTHTLRGGLVTRMDVGDPLDRL
jgi:ketosteroid isomerase-like protein